MGVAAVLEPDLLLVCARVHTRVGAQLAREPAAAQRGRNKSEALTTDEALQRISSMARPLPPYQ